jgi:general secretion pathway protein H
MMKMSILRYWLRRSHRFLKGSFHAHFENGFTLVELLIVVVIISIAAMISIPIMSSGGNMQIRSAANMIVADLEYAKSIAITRQEDFSVSFDSNNDCYEVQDANGVVILHPVSKRPYRIDFPNDQQLSRVGIDVPSLTVTFDSLGSPSSGGVVNLSLKGSGGGTITQVMIEPVTGFVSISE